MSKPVMTEEIAWAVGWDEGYRRMRAAGRKKWNREDYNAAARKTNKLLIMICKDPQLKAAMQRDLLD